MKKVLLVVALLLLATPVFAADVTIVAEKVGAMNTADSNHLQQVRIGYTGAAAADAIRGFALVLTVDNGGNLDHIRDFNSGECKSVGGGYGIFPGKFRDYVNPASPNWADINYNPLAPWNDLGSQGGNDNPKMVVELGTIYQDPNYPGASGTLFSVDVNMEGKTQVCLTVALDSIRGGVVKKDSSAASVTLPAVLCITEVSNCTEPNIVGMTMTDANNALIAAGFTASPIITYEPNGLKTALRVDRSTPPFGGVQSCSAPTSYVVDTNCLYVGRFFDLPTGLVDITVTQSMIDKWNYLNKPACWCCISQKRGNAVYAGTGATVTNAADLAAVKNVATWGKAYTQAGYNACADFDMSGTVNAADLAKVKNTINWSKVTGPAPPCQ